MAVGAKMKKIIIYTIFFLTFLSLKSFADTYWGSDFLTADEAQKKWGMSLFVAKKFKNSQEKTKQSMAVDVVKKASICWNRNAVGTQKHRYTR